MFRFFLTKQAEKNQITLHFMITCRQAAKMAGKQAAKMAGNMEKRGGSVPAPARAPGISKVFVEVGG